MVNYEILAHEEVAADAKYIVLAGKIAAVPGQFLQVRISETNDPLLRRPLSVHDCHENSFSLLYRIAGRGTAMLAQKKTGDNLNILGPLGKGFPHTTLPTALLVAGGIGVAPLFYLARCLAEKGKKVVFLFGARQAEALYRRRELAEIVSELHLATDNGSTGLHGPVTELLESFWEYQVKFEIYACGPALMLQEISRLAAGHDRDVHVSLETQLACGVGACLGCVVADRTQPGKYFRVCSEGPVFNSKVVF
ncbi:MAG TPA: dihydroorotate dehydrogenase electron transfer subunit [Candidatus Limnocylindrales bacterium]|nr:dihydroorotate dehydrogenase electron transfer subunit [Candidatus Limnocylindrales bacterium]